MERIAVVKRCELLSWIALYKSDIIIIIIIIIITNVGGIIYSYLSFVQAPDAPAPQREVICSEVAHWLLKPCEWHRLVQLELACKVGGVAEPDRV